MCQPFFSMWKMLPPTSLVPRPRGKRKTAWYRLFVHVQSCPEKPGNLFTFGNCQYKINTCTSDIYFRIIERLPVEYLQLHEKWRIYKGEDAFLWLTTSLGKSGRYEVLSTICVLDRKQSELGTGRVATPLSC